MELKRVQKYVLYYDGFPVVPPNIKSKIEELGILVYTDVIPYHLESIYPYHYLETRYEKKEDGVHLIRDYMRPEHDIEEHNFISRQFDIIDGTPVEKVIHIVDKECDYVEIKSSREFQRLLIAVHGKIAKTHFYDDDVRLLAIILK